MHKLCFIDTETTGIDPAKHGLIQIGAIMCTADDGVITERERFNLHIRPFPQDAIEDSALAVNNITREMLKEYVPAVEGYPQFEKFLGRHVAKFDKTDKAFFIGYNARFDMDFIREFFRKSGDTYFGSYFWFPPIDVMNMAALELMEERPAMPDFKLKTVALAIGFELPENLHDAFADIEITRSIYKYILDPRSYLGMDAEEKKIAQL